MNQLDFVIAGAQKGGSTQLAEHLARVEGVWLPKGENPCFESPYYETGSVNQLRFELESRAVGSAVCGIKRPSYLGISCIPERIHREFPKVKIIIVLRDPVDRAVSAYLHKAQYGQIKLLPVSRAMMSILDGDDMGNPRTYEALAWSRYSTLLPKWLDRFGEQLLVVGSGDLRHDERAVLLKVSSHLGIDYRLESAVPSESNVGARTMLEMRFRRQMHRAMNEFNPMTQQLMPRTSNPLRLGYAAAMREGSRIVHGASSAKSAELKLSPEVRAKLADYFTDDYRFVVDNFQINL